MRTTESSIATSMHGQHAIRKDVPKTHPLPKGLHLLTSTKVHKEGGGESKRTG